MAVLLWCVAGYLALDALVTVGGVGKRFEITPGVAVLTVVTRGLMVTFLVLAAVHGVTP